MLQVSSASIQGLGQADRVPELISTCLEIMACYVNCEFDEDTALEGIGFNSIDAVEIVSDINTRLGTKANPMLMMEVKTVRDLAMLLDRCSFYPWHPKQLG